MDRRKFLKGLLALPFVPLVTKLASKFSGSDQTSLTLLDWAKAQDRPMLPIVEALSQRNNLLQDMVWRESTPTGHRVTMGTRLPRVNWLKRSINGY